MRRTSRDPRRAASAAASVRNSRQWVRDDAERRLREQHTAQLEEWACRHVRQQWNSAQRTAVQNSAYRNSVTDFKSLSKTSAKWMHKSVSTIKYHSGLRDMLNGLMSFLRKSMWNTARPAGSKSHHMALETKHRAMSLEFLERVLVRNHPRFLVARSPRHRGAECS